jgi:hypothetical protein
MSDYNRGENRQAVVSGLLDVESSESTMTNTEISRNAQSLFDNAVSEGLLEGYDDAIFNGLVALNEEGAEHFDASPGDLWINFSYTDKGESWSSCFDPRDNSFCPGGSEYNHFFESAK